LAIQPEILITQKGAKYEAGENWWSTVSLTYLEIPLLAKLSIPIKSSVKPFVFGGPSYSIKIGGKHKWKYFWMSSELEEKLSGFEAYDFGIVIGLGSNFIADTAKFSFELRYTMGLKTIFYDVDSEAELKNNKIISFMVGYYF